MPSRRRDFCFAPGCRGGYSRVKDAPKASLFNVPRDEERRKQWDKNLHRADKVLDEMCAACKLHFEPRCVIKNYDYWLRGPYFARVKPNYQTMLFPRFFRIFRLPDKNNPNTKNEEMVFGKRINDEQ
ncbi:hypothetical protein HPB48_026427 [Haemaphysalis longicornis]|uniref:THAP-type domain-containing protein n=1 Tax=Haemaphysalis longicornis TaxID=44386 RepID=A0A9J6HAR0_HAELO|nr:hypothetical protein HPB48_026427 [Haemaphysalis longicornis]